MPGLSDDLCLAARMGDVATVQAWLEAGGNPDERMARSDATDTNMRGHEIGQTLLLPRTVNGTGHTGPSEFCATSI